MFLAISNLVPEMQELNEVKKRITAITISQGEIDLHVGLIYCICEYSGLFSTSHNLSDHKTLGYSALFQLVLSPIIYRSFQSWILKILV